MSQGAADPGKMDPGIAELSGRTKLPRREEEAPTMKYYYVVCNVYFLATSKAPDRLYYL